MKCKFGDLTLRQLHDVCQKQPVCTRCPLYGTCSDPRIRNARLNAEIDLPDEEENEK